MGKGLPIFGGRVRIRRFDEVSVGEVGVTGGGAVPPVAEQAAEQRQVLAGHDGMAGIGVTEVVQSQPAETRTLAYGAPACREPEPPRPWAYRGNRKAPARRSPGSASQYRKRRRLAREAARQAGTG